MSSSINASTSGAGGLISTADNSGVLNIQTAGTTAVTIDTSQNVGIGTSSPAYKFQVIGNIGVPITNSYYTYTSDYGFGTPDSAGLQIFTAASDSIRFGQRSSGTFTEKMRIDSSGNLLVGVTSTFTSIVQGIQAQAVGGASLALNRTTNTGAVARFFYAGTEVGNISVTGSATTFNSTSDYRLKENVVPMTDALNKVSLLKPVTYTWKADGSAGQGFIAHELQSVIPDAVTGEKDAIDKNGNPEYQSIDPRNIVATLTAAIQELNAKVEAQAATITALQAKVGV